MSAHRDSSFAFARKSACDDYDEYETQESCRAVCAASAMEGDSSFSKAQLPFDRERQYSR
jgi:hypothetical protein